MSTGDRPASEEQAVSRGAPLSGRVGLVLGLANEHSIAYGCARALRDAGAELAITYRNARAEGHARPLAERLRCAVAMPCDVERPGKNRRENGNAR